MPILKLKELDLNYRLSGNGSPILVIHGLGGDNTSWEFVEPILSKHYQMILPDLRCHGKSGCPEGIRPPSEFAEDLALLVRHLGHSKLPVMGISLGGLVVQQLVIDFPDLFNAAILVDTTARITEHIMDMVYTWREIQVEEGDEAYWRKSTADGVSAEYIKNNPERMEYLRQKFLSAEPTDLAAAALGFVNFDSVESLKQLKMPVLIIHGGKDKLMPPEYAHLLHDSIPDSRLEIIPGVGHSSDLEAPEQISHLVMEFIQQQSSS